MLGISSLAALQASCSVETMVTADTKGPMIFTCCRSRTTSMSGFPRTHNGSTALLFLLVERSLKKVPARSCYHLTRLSSSVVNSYTEFSTTVVNKVEAAIITEQLVRQVSSPCAEGISTVTVGDEKGSEVLVMVQVFPLVHVVQDYPASGCHFTKTSGCLA